MHISINTEDGLSASDIRVLKALIGDTETFAAPAKEQAEKPAPAKKAAAPAKKAEPEPEPEPEPEEDLVGGGDVRTKEDAIKEATTLVSQGKTAQVKKALAAVGAKKVSEIPDDQVEEFFAAL